MIFVLDHLTKIIPLKKPFRHHGLWRGCKKIKPLLWRHWRL